MVTEIDKKIVELEIIIRRCNPSLSDAERAFDIINTLNKTLYSQQNIITQQKEQLEKPE